MITMPFNSGNSQAIRLPKSMAFPPNIPVQLIQDGDRIIIEPVKTLEEVPYLFLQLGELLKNENGEIEFQREELEESERIW